MSEATVSRFNGAPFIHVRASTAGHAWLTVAVLVPSLAWNCLVQGWRSFLVVVATVAVALVADVIQSAVRRRFELGDGSAVLTGLMIGLLMPGGVGYGIPVAAALFAILVVKGAFGGLGNNWMNPALGGVVFVWMNWPKIMETLFGGGSPASQALPLINGLGGIDTAATSMLNERLFSLFGTRLPDGYLGLMLGIGGQTGLSGFILLASSIVLVSLRIVRWQVPASVFLSFAALEWAFGGLPRGNSLFAGDVLGSTFAGSFILVCFFMASDPVTSPSRRLPMVLYGSGIGILAFTMEAYGSRAAAMAFAVVIMNCVVPLLDRQLGHRARRPSP